MQWNGGLNRYHKLPRKKKVKKHFGHYKFQKYPFHIAFYPPVPHCFLHLGSDMQFIPLKQKDLSGITSSQSFVR